MREVVLFVPCFVDQFQPSAARSAVAVLERLGCRVHVAASASCCGQPPTNAGYHDDGAALLSRFEQAHVREVPGDAPIVVLSGSCAQHVRAHTTHEGLRRRVQEFTAFLHDEIGLPALAALDATCRARVAVHIGCHALRGLGLAVPSERGPGSTVAPRNLVTAVLAQVHGLEVAPLTRPDECCGFGGTFALGQPELSTRMGSDRLRDMRHAKAEAVVTTDLSCALHLRAVAEANGAPLPMWHVAEVLDPARRLGRG